MSKGADTGSAIGWDERPQPSTRRKTRPVPSPLQESTVATVARTASDLSGPLSPSKSSSFTRAVHSTEQVPTTLALASDRVRAPNPAKKAPTSPAIEEFRSAVTRDALRDEAKKAAVQSRNVSAPVLAAAPQLSPPTSPTMASSSTSRPSHRAELRSIDGRTIMPRTASIDSTVSTLSTATTASQQQNGSSAYRVSQESAGPENVAALIASAGSAEAAVQKLVGEKNQAASHNAQLWRLVEKQRAMILGLNKDLEKALKEKERYRRKLKDNLAESQSAPVLTSAGQAVGEGGGRESSQSPALLADPSRDVASIAAMPSSMRKVSEDSRKVSDSSDVASLLPGRSDTPQDTTNPSSSDTQPSTPRSTGSGGPVVRDSENAGTILGRSNTMTKTNWPTIETAATGANRGEPLRTPLSAATMQQSPLLPAPGNSLSSPKAANRKAPPAPLQLSPKSVAPPPNVANNIVDASDSEYEEDPDSARAEYELRGRRKTREEDDQEREEIAKQEEEYRSRSKKESKSKSLADKTGVASDDFSPAAPQPAAVQHAPEERVRAQAYQGNADPLSIVRQRALSDAAGMLQKSSTAPSLLSPGLPMSPRPIDKPLNSPMPRAPKAGLSAMPMSPKAGLPMGLPMSPRAPRQPLPLPPQTPLTFASPHLARAEKYHQQAQAQPSIAEKMKPSPEPSPEQERPSMSSDPNPKSPGEVYRGLVTEQYPELLLPPNALPSIYIKTSSSRMKPSRQSYIAPKHENESPVLTLAVYERSDRTQLWRVEKTVAALVLLDTQIKSACGFRDRVPDKALFTGHSPAKIDARRAALDTYFDRMLDSLENEKAARIVCKFLSSDAIGAETGDYFNNAGAEARPDTPVAKHRTQRAGYLTKRGKNFGGWKARYFVLDGPQLKYFEAPGGAHMGSIKLQNAQIGKQSNSAATSVEDEDNQFRHAFLVLEPKKKDSTSLVRHVLCAESDEERDAWVEALLQYVDFRDEEEDILKGTQAVQPDISGARSPRLQKSMNDLRPVSRSKDLNHLTPDAVRSLHYNDTRPGEAPVIGVPTNVQKNGTPSPDYDGGFTPTNEHGPAAQHPMISGPTNLHVISNAGDWGMKVPPTPQGKEHAKDKKRSMFAAFRGRSSSDLAPSMMSPAFPPGDPRGAAGVRAVFGVPLAEAVQFAHPADATTELPAVVYRCIQYLTYKNAIKEEGIFRLSGSSTVIKALKDRFNEEGDVNLVAEDNHYDIHAVASLLKLYMRELPSSILTRDLHLEFLQCLELHGRDKVVALNVLVNRLPRPNRALLQALSNFLLSIVSNADVNKMNVRNVGIVFAPTLNVPAPLISSFVEDQAEIFGPRFDEPESPISVTEMVPQSMATDLRSPRKQMFSDLPTPAYNQTTFQSMNGPQDDTGMIPMQPSYASYQMAPQGEGGFGSLNDALRSPTIYSTTGNGPLTPREVKSKRRESAMMFLNPSSNGPQKKTSMSRLREEGGSF